LLLHKNAKTSIGAKDKLVKPKLNLQFFGLLKTLLGSKVENKTSKETRQVLLVKA
jgi:hypothetical protein